MPPNNMAGNPIAASPKEVISLLRIGYLKFPRRYLSISPVTVSKSLQSTAIFVLVKIRPKGRCDIPFRVGGLPDEKIAYT